MSQYARSFGDFSIVDGTHNTVMYELNLIPYTSVDCLGRNVITGIVLDESENGDSVLEGLELFGLAVSGFTLMTDGGLAFPSAVETLGMNNVLCLYHFQRDIIKLLVVWQRKRVSS